LIGRKILIQSHAKAARELMKIIMLFLIGVFLAGCATNKDDSRLQGAWNCNVDATVAVIIQQKPDWTNAPPSQSKMLNEMFHDLSITYSNGMARVYISNSVGDSFHYRVVDRGTNYVVLRREKQPPLEPDARIRFMDGATNYWTEVILGRTPAEQLGYWPPMRFDKAP
jgi:hypothetical protein